MTGLKNIPKPNSLVARDIAVRQIATYRPYVGDSTPFYLEDEKTAQQLRDNPRNIFASPRLVVVPKALALRAVERFGAERALKKSKKLLSQPDFQQDFEFSLLLNNPRVFSQSDGHLTRAKFCVGLPPDEDTFKKLSELNHVVHLAFGVRDFPLHTSLTVAEFPLEHQANRFAEILSQTNAGSGVLHFGLPIDVNFS